MTPLWRSGRQGGRGELDHADGVQTRDLAEALKIIKKHGRNIIRVGMRNGNNEGRTLVILRLKIKQSSHLAKELEGSGYSTNSSTEPETHL